MTFPLNLWDVSLLLAIVAIILLVTSELLPRYGRVSILINRKRLRNAATAVSTLFLITVAVRIADVILSH
jgi:uncharacterized membrane protein